MAFAIDAGGETMWGITIGTARQHGYQGPMRDMPRDVAARIYRQSYVIGPGFDRIAELCAPVGEELVDTGVNMGVAVAGRFLQRALNSLNRNGRDFADVVVDGECGRATRIALSAFLKRLLEAQQAVRYMEISAARPSNENFMFGWVSNRVGQL